MIGSIFDIIAPVFLLIFAGSGAVKLGWLSNNGVDGLMSFALKFAAPCLLFQNIKTLDLAQSFDVGILSSYYIPATLSFLLGFAVARLFFNRRPGEAVAIGFAALFSNSLLLGLPISERAYGIETIGTNISIISVHAPFCYLLGISVMEILRADGRGFGHTIRAISSAMFHNPLMIGIGLGFIVNIFGIPIFAPVIDVVDMLAQVMLPSALFALGGVLSRYSISKAVPEAATIAIISLFFHPLLAFIFAKYVFDLQFEVLRNLVVTAAMAPGINAFLFANMYKRAEDVAANTVLLATVMSIFTASGWIWFLG